MQERLGQPAALCDIDAISVKIGEKTLALLFLLFTNSSIWLRTRRINLIQYLLISCFLPLIIFFLIRWKQLVTKGQTSLSVFLSRIVLYHKFKVVGYFNLVSLSWCLLLEG